MALKLFERFQTETDPNPAGDGLTAANIMLGQGFTVGTVGDNEEHIPKKIRLKLSNFEGIDGNLTVAIFSANQTTGKPEEELVTATIPQESIIFGWYEIDINDENTVTLRKSGKYAIVIYADTFDTEDPVNWFGDGTATYAGGAAWYSNDSGATWSAASDVVDFNFEVHGNEWILAGIITHEDVLTKVGSGASAVSSSADYIRDYTRNALAVVNCRTLEDWTSVIATLGENVKYFFTDLLARMAAIEVINYDLEGYDGGRIEGQQMIENLRESSELLIMELKDAKMKTFILKTTEDA